MRTLTRTTYNYTEIPKMAIAEAVFSSQDVGGNTKDKFVNCVLEGNEVPEPEKDLLSAYLVQKINEAHDIEDLEMDLSYAISMLQRANKSIKQFTK